MKESALTCLLNRVIDFSIQVWSMCTLYNTIYVNDEKVGIYIV